MADEDKPYAGGPGGAISKAIGRLVYGPGMEAEYKREREKKNRPVEPQPKARGNGRQPKARGDYTK